MWGTLQRFRSLLERRHAVWFGPELRGLSDLFYKQLWLISIEHPNYMLLFDEVN